MNISAEEANIFHVSISETLNSQKIHVDALEGYHAEFIDKVILASPVDPFKAFAGDISKLGDLVKKIKNTFTQIEFIFSEDSFDSVSFQRRSPLLAVIHKDDLPIVQNLDAVYLDCEVAGVSETA